MTELPKTMKSPRDSRPGVWPMGVNPNAKFGGVLQIWITRACDLSCIGCTQGSNLGGKPAMMTPQQFEVAVKSLCAINSIAGKLVAPAYPGVIGIFGGNPCIHPQFPEICEILRRYVPFDQRGLWSNNLMGMGLICKKTFNPDVSNLNVHMSEEAMAEFRRDWPLAQPKGMEDSRHSPPFVAMQDMEDMTDDDRWNLIGNCDVNQRWSALIGVFRGELRGYFCELAGSQAMLHQAEPDYPDLGVPVVPGWWNHPIAFYDSQVRFHCFSCGHPLRGRGDFARTGTVEQVSKTHAGIYKLKKPFGKKVQIVTKRSELGEPVSAATQYLPGEQP